MLQNRQIKHVFFNAFHDFKVYDNNQFDWSNCYMHPYSWDNTYVHWCASHGYKEITPGWYHYEPAGQRAWAEHLVDYIKEYKIL